jgi:hypothetical protein
MHTPRPGSGQAASVTTMAGEAFPREFEEVFQEHYVLVYRTAYGVTGRVEDAEDVVQTIFLRLLQRERPPDFLKRGGRGLPCGGQSKAKCACARDAPRRRCDRANRSRRIQRWSRVPCGRKLPGVVRRTRIAPFSRTSAGAWRCRQAPSRLSPLRPVQRTRRSTRQRRANRRDRGRNSKRHRSGRAIRTTSPSLRPALAAAARTASR